MDARPSQDSFCRLGGTSIPADPTLNFYSVPVRVYSQCVPPSHTCSPPSVSNPFLCRPFPQTDGIAYSPALSSLLLPFLKAFLYRPAFIQCHPRLLLLRLMLLLLSFSLSFSSPEAAAALSPLSSLLRIFLSSRALKLSKRALWWCAAALDLKHLCHLYALTTHTEPGGRLLCTLYISFCTQLCRF